MNHLEKNLLDLRHSLSTTKASLFFGIGFGGALALFFGFMQLIEDTFTALLIAEVWLIIFVWRGINYFVECGKIQDEIKNKIS